MSIGPGEALVARLRDAVMAARLSQGELARLTETHQPVVQRWLTLGAVPSGVALTRLPAALGVSGHWLLTGEGPRTPPGTAEAEVYERGRAAGWAEAVGALRLAEAAATGAEVPAEILELARRVIEAGSNPAADPPRARPRGGAGTG